ncbi:uncharacterized protein VTP21DRAFT_3048 [Calcarisporiella thermophila]|uniref:uncharacterized protein n=1 Tax=Calcarisporiella thermophila TaxID=911321 RepID=UPI003742CA88
MSKSRAKKEAKPKELISPQEFFGGDKGKKGRKTNPLQESMDLEADQDTVPSPDAFEDNDDDYFEETSDIKKATKSKGSGTKKRSAKATSSNPQKKIKTDSLDNQSNRREEATEKDLDEDNAQEKDGKKKSTFFMFKNRAPPEALGSKEIPVGAPNCLKGLTFVFTGELSSITREDAADLVKRYGGRVTGQPSSKTSYVVIGRDAGPKKLEVIKAKKLKTLDEDGFFELVRTSSAKSEETVETTQPKQTKKTKAEKLDQTFLPASTSEEATRLGIFELWTDKYRPQKLQELCGNKGLIEKLSYWLQDWQESYSNGFKTDGRSTWSKNKAVLISGPPGIGKTTAAHLVSRLNGYEIIELNASDTRNKKSLENTVKELIDNRIVTEFYSAPKSSTEKGKKAIETSQTNKNHVLIMDEVDGMSAGDRGGIAQLNQFIKKTKIPIICICNDRQSPKIRTLANSCGDVRFHRPMANQIRSRIMMIATREGLKIDANAVDQLAASTQSDIRQMINLLSAYRLDAKSMNYDESKSFGKSAEKYTQLDIFKIANGLLSQSVARDMTFADKLDLYFHDYSLAPLMIQENYIKMHPARAAEFVTGNHPKKMELSVLELLSRAADSISDADNIDRLMRGSEQHWSLMPVHAYFSCVRPSYFAAGGGGGRYDFPGWLGKNSKAQKYLRLLQHIQAHMRVRISGDKNELRQSYIPMMLAPLTTPLIRDGETGADEVIKMMDEYYLSKEDWDSIMELHMMGEGVLKKIPSKAKTAFTRRYNKMAHPTILQEATAIAKDKKVSLVPDMEEAFVDDEELIASEAEEEEEEGDKNKLETSDDIKFVGTKTKGKPQNNKAKASRSRK